MTRHWSRFAVAGAMVLLGAACTDVTSRSASDLNAAAVAAALSSVPVGYGDLSSSYIGLSADGIGQSSLWLGGGRDARFDRRGFMGGGLQDAFLGAIPFGLGHFGDRGPFGGGLHCDGRTFDAASGRIVCPEVTRHGLTVNRSAQLKDGSGTVQQAFDTITTNSVNMRSSVAGTVIFDRSADEGDDLDNHSVGGPHRGWGNGRGPGGRLLGDTSTILTATTVINTSSDRTVSGLAQASTSRTINGASKGSESTTGTSSRGTFAATRLVGDTTSGLVIPVRTSDTPTYPTAGSVIRAIQATLKYEGQDQVSVSRREVITYDGSTTAKVVITENGATKNCTRPLPRGPLSCS